MIPTNNIPTPSIEGPEDSQKTILGGSKPAPRKIAPSVDDGQKGKPFREVLDDKLSDKDAKKAAPIAMNEEDADEPSIFDLSSQPTQNAKPAIKRDKAMVEQGLEGSVGQGITATKV